jgi:hypothetical protein
VPTLTVTQAVLAVHGVTASDMEAPELAPEVALGLRAELEENGFDLTARSMSRSCPATKAST